MTRTGSGEMAAAPQLPSREEFVALSTAMVEAQCSYAVGMGSRIAVDAAQDVWCDAVARLFEFAERQAVASRVKRTVTPVDDSPECDFCHEIIIGRPRVEAGYAFCDESCLQNANERYWTRKAERDAQ
jgi:hypothetical protein